MTREEAKEIFLNRGFIDGIYDGNKWREACIVISKWLEQESTTKNDLKVDAVSRQAINGYIDYILNHGMGKKKSFDFIKKFVTNMPPVTPQEPRCKDCKWWKDSDGMYRRGVGAESKCPINNVSVNHGLGYCYMFLPKADMRDEEE